MTRPAPSASPFTMLGSSDALACTDEACGVPAGPGIPPAEQDA